MTPTSTDLSLSKTVDNATPNVGENVTFSIVVNNSGPDAASGVTVLDSLPAGVTLVSQLPSQGTYNTGTGIWTVGSIASGAGATLQLEVSVDSIGTKTNTAQISAADQDDPDSTPGNSNASEDDQDAVSITPLAADLSLLKSVSNSSPNVGENVTFTVTVANDGPDMATNVRVTDALPSGLTLVSSTPNQGTYNSSTGDWNIGSIASGGNATLVIVATVTTTASITNTAQVVAADQFDSDSTPANGQASEDDQDSVTLSPQSADLSLTKSVNDTTPNVGDNVTFTITVGNAGTNDATGVTVSDALPAGLTLVSSTASAGSYNGGTGIWTIGNLTSGSSVTLDVIATVTTSGDKTNTAEVATSDQSDPDSTPGNSNSSEDDQAAVTITPQLIDLSLTKTTSSANPNVGDTVTFTITASNAGPGDATGVAVTDVLPTDLTFSNATATRGSYNSATGIWTVGAIANGESVSLDIVATVAAVGTKTNSAEVTAADQPDSDSTPSNNIASEDDQASASVTPLISDLSLSKTVDNSTPNVNDNVTFTIVVSNAGPDAATNVSVQDALPAGLTFVSFSSSQGTYNSTNGTWAVGTINSGGSESLNLVGTVTNTGIKTNTAEITASDQTDPDSTPNNSNGTEDDQASVSVTPQIADLRLTKSVDDSTPAANQQVTFTINVTNDGPDDATNTVIRDVLPAGTTYVSSTSSIGSYN